MAIDPPRVVVDCHFGREKIYSGGECQRSDAATPAADLLSETMNPRSAQWNASRDWAVPGTSDT
jgi:hypothetical protein